MQRRASRSERCGWACSSQQRDFTLVRGRWGAPREEHLTDFWEGVVLSNSQTPRARSESPRQESARWNVTDFFVVRVMRLLVLPVLVPLFMLILMILGPLTFGSHMLLWEIYSVAISTAVFTVFSNSLMYSFLHKSALRIEVFLGWIIVAAIMTCSRLLTCHYIFMDIAGFISCLFFPWLCAAVRTACESWADARVVLAGMIILFIGGLVPAVGFGLYSAMWIGKWNLNIGMTILSALLWGVLPFMLKPIGTWLCPKIAVAEKGLAGAVFGFYVDSAIGAWGGLIFMTDFVSILYYCLTLLPLLVLQFARGSEVVFSRLPKFLRCSKELHLHRMIVYLEIFGSVIGRATSLSIASGLKISMAGLKPDNVVGSQGSKHLTVFFVITHDSLKDSPEVDFVMIFLSAAFILFFGFAAFRSLADYKWWDRNRRAVVPEEDTKQYPCEVTSQTLGRGTVPEGDDDQERIQTANQAQSDSRNQAPDDPKEEALVDVEKIMPAELPRTQEGIFLEGNTKRGHDDSCEGVRTVEVRKVKGSQPVSQEIGLQKARRYPGS